MTEWYSYGGNDRLAVPLRNTSLEVRAGREPSREEIESSNLMREGRKISHAFFSISIITSLYGVLNSQPFMVIPTVASIITAGLALYTTGAKYRKAREASSRKREYQGYTLEER